MSKAGLCKKLLHIDALSDSVVGPLMRRAEFHYRGGGGGAISRSKAACWSGDRVPYKDSPGTRNSMRAGSKADHHGQRNTALGSRLIVKVCVFSKRTPGIWIGDASSAASRADSAMLRKTLSS